MTNIADSEGSQFKNQFSVTRSGAEGTEGSDWLFTCDDEKKKKEWVDKLRSIVKEFQREAAKQLKANQHVGSGSSSPSTPSPVGSSLAVATSSAATGSGLRIGGSPLPGRKNP